jgi:hypothetical protein
VRRALNERGSALWEFAFVLTVMLTLIFGVMEFSQVMYAYHFVSNAAREATRYASVRGSTFAAAPFGPCPAAAMPPIPFECEAESSGVDVAYYVQSLIPSGMYVSGNATAVCTTPALHKLNVCATWPGTSPNPANPCPNPPAGGENPGCLVKVQVLYTYGFSLPFLSKQLGSITLTSTSETVIQQ